MEQTTHWEWRPRRWWIGLLIFWLIAGGGAGVMARSGVPGVEPTSPAFITAVTVIFVIWAATTDRGGWGVPVRIGWVIGLWLLHAVLSVALSLILGYLITSAGINNPENPDMLARAGNLYAAFPIVIWAMRRSRVFVREVPPSQ